MYYYVGLNENKIGKTNLFSGSITIIGSNSNNNYAYDKIYKKSLDYNDINNINEISRFYSEYMLKIVEKDKDAKFMFYSLIDTTKLNSKLLKHIICNNSNKNNALLNNKIKCRQLLSDAINIIDYKYLSGKDVSLNKIKVMIPNYKRFVVQQPFGFSGFGTYLLSEKNEELIKSKLNYKQIYSISGYEEKAIPINNTFVISKNEISILPGSLQNILVGDELNYDGFDFEKYQYLDEKLKNKIYIQTYNICQRLQKIGYRGIGGIDYIIVNEEVYFMEINPRFQASTTKLNDILIENGYPDIYKLNLNSFYDN